MFSILSLYAQRVSRGVKQKFYAICNMRDVHDLGKYLRFPLLKGRVTKDPFPLFQIKSKGILLLGKRSFLIELTDYVSLIIFFLPFLYILCKFFSFLIPCVMTWIRLSKIFSSPLQGTREVGILLIMRSFIS